MRLGYETIDQIRNDLDAGILEQKFPLNSNQRIGIKYYEDFLEKMTRKEVEQIADIVKEATWERFPKANITIMGSYRRGKETCGDIDLLITEPSYSKVTPPGALGELVSRLAERGHLSFHLTPNLEGMNNGATESQSSYDCSQESILPPPNPTGGKPSFVILHGSLLLSSSSRQDATNRYQVLSLSRTSLCCPLFYWQWLVQ